MANNIHFDFLAAFYDRVIGPPDPERLKAMLDIPCAGWMLDAAGGTGRVAGMLCAWVEHLVICDLSYPMLAQSASKSSAGATCLLPSQARVERLPFPNGWFNRILVVDAFHHFSDQPGALAELARVLAPNGRMVIEEPDIHTFGVKLIALGENLALMNSHFRSGEEIGRMVETAGLSARVELRDSTAWVIAEKKTGG